MAQLLTIGHIVGSDTIGICESDKTMDDNLRMRSKQQESSCSVCTRHHSAQPMTPIEGRALTLQYLVSNSERTAVMVIGVLQWPLVVDHVMSIVMQSNFTATSCSHKRFPSCDGINPHHPCVLCRQIEVRSRSGAILGRISMVCCESSEHMTHMMQ